MKRFQRAGDTKWRLQSSLKPLVFARLLAKIAHTFSIAYLGIDSFTPLLSPLILGETDTAAHLVGRGDPPTSPTTPPVGTTKTGHNVAFCAMAENGASPLLVAKI